MERVAPLFVLLCAAFFTAAAASAPISPPLVAHSGSASSSSASATEAASLVKPLARRGKAVEKYVAKLRPTVVNGKVVGCKGASGKTDLKAVRYSATTYYVTLSVRLLRLKTGGPMPGNKGFSTACRGVIGGGGMDWVNITSDKEGHAKRYSFIGSMRQGPLPVAAAEGFIQQLWKFGKYYQAGYTGTSFALCGKFKKVV